MNFPITFPSPAEAVKAIYDDMLPSNPSCRVNLEIETEDGITFQNTIVGIKKSSQKILVDDDQHLLHIVGKSKIVRYMGVYDIKSITITSIQSVESNLKELDRVLMIESGITGTLSIHNDDGGIEQIIVIGDNGKHYICEIGDLIKLPLHSDSSTDD